MSKAIRYRPSVTICAILAAIGIGLLAVYSYRRSAGVDKLGSALAQCRSEAEAASVIRKMAWSDIPDSATNTRRAWASFGRGSQWLDWWLLIHPMPSARVINMMVSTEFFAEGEMQEVDKRADIIEQIAWGRIFEQSLRKGNANGVLSIELVKEVFLGWDRNEYLMSVTTEELFGDVYVSHREASGRVVFDPWFVNELRVAYWCFGRESEIREVTQISWLEKYRDLRQWITENERFMYFDQQRLQFLVDAEAKRNGTVLEASQRQGRLPHKPWPHWKGPVPTAR
ncbi:MAG: hypothetical protein WD847_06675 [Pirellulales bacterium]